MAIDYTKRPKPSQAPSTPAPVPPATPAPAAASAVNLSKIALTKQAPSVNLAKPGASGGTIRINLNWAQGESSGGLFGKRKKGVDLDLRCLYELADGSRGAPGSGTSPSVSPDLERIRGHGAPAITRRAGRS